MSREDKTAAEKEIKEAKASETASSEPTDAEKLKGVGSNNPPKDAIVREVDHFTNAYGWTGESYSL